MPIAAGATVLLLLLLPLVVVNSISNVLRRRRRKYTAGSAIAAVSGAGDGSSREGARALLRTRPGVDAVALAAAATDVAASTNAAAVPLAATPPAFDVVGGAGGVRGRLALERGSTGGRRHLFRLAALLDHHVRGETTEHKRSTQHEVVAERLRFGVSLGVWGRERRGGGGGGVGGRIGGREREGYGLVDLYWWVYFHISCENVRHVSHVQCPRLTDVLLLRNRASGDPLRKVIYVSAMIERGFFSSISRPALGEQD